MFSAILSFGYIRYTNRQYNKVLPGEFEKLTGTIKSSAEEKKYTYCYTVEIDNLQNLGNVTFKLYVKKNEKTKRLEYGDKINITKGTIELSEPARNYGGFSEENYFKSKKIFGKIYANKEDIEIVAKTRLTIDKFGYYARESIKKNIRKYIPEENAKILIAVLEGEKSELANNTIEEFRKSNLIHILCISGAHISFLVMGINKITEFLGRNKRLKISILTVFMLICIIGFSASTLRACIMAIIALTGKLFFKKSDSINAISISFIFLFLYNPFIIHDLGFLLSYAGTIGIISFACILKKKNKTIYTKEKGHTLILKVKQYCYKTLVTTASAQIMLMPIIAYFYNTFSLIVLVTNLIAAPLFEIILYSGYTFLILSYIFRPGCILIKGILNACISAFTGIAKISSDLPISQINIARPNYIFLIIYYIFAASVLVCFKRNIPINFEKFIKIIKNNYKKLITFACCIVLVTTIVYTSPSDFCIYFVDVGQGDCTLIKTTHNKTIMIDSGGTENLEEYDVGKQVVVPYLLARGITKLDYILISHFHADHCNGFISVMNTLKIGTILIAKQDTPTKEFCEFIKVAKEKNIKIEYIKQEQKINLDTETNLEILYIGQGTDNLNNTSVIARINYYNFSILFTGDAEKEEEAELLKKYNAQEIKANILKIGHHGAKTSSTQAFLNAVKPQIALIGVGKKNNFGHPNEETIKRLENLNTKIYRTDQVGEITIKVNNKGYIKIRTQL
ncbi:MAG: DNA internalization-related competence protein ComEC/Rec2 [Clostridia bacterium]|nr:DNA internalization-related competence protein ComEC/Rec2 [Clostridia bacterium]